MRTKLIMALVDESLTAAVLESARTLGCLDVIVIGPAQGAGALPAKTFFDLNLLGRRDVVLLLARATDSPALARMVAEAAGLGHGPGRGRVFLLAVEDVVGLPAG